MPEPELEISPAAIDDISQIQSFSERTFGEMQAQIYLDDLRKAIQSLVDRQHSSCDSLA